MKDKVFRLCALCCCSLPLVAAGQVIQNNGGQIWLNGQFLRSANIPSAPEMMPEPSNDVVEFVDGSALHGEMARMDVEHGLTWTTPEAKSAINFRPDHLDSIRFAHGNSMSLKPTCHLWFSDGDDLYGSISSLDNEKVGFNTWFGGSMIIPRAALRSITFLSRNYSVMYEGPYDEGGWLVINNSPKSWSFRDGAFIGSGQGSIGRDLSLTNSATVEFDLSWNGTFSLGVAIYCDVMDRVEVNAGSCVVDLNPTKVNLHSSQNNMGVPFNVPGVSISETDGKNRMHVAIECNKTDGTASVFINHVLAKTWKDCNFQGGGTGIMFAQQANMFMSGDLKLGHVKISQWQGRSEPETFDSAATNDAICFVNNDRAGGNIESIHDGKVKMNLSGMVLDIPLERVTQLQFAASQTPSPEQGGPWQVRAHFPGGGSVSFQLEKWDGNVVSGRSAIFGTLAFQPNAIRQIDFNLNRPREESNVSENKEFEGLDE